jgi:hypothetical protein
VLDEKFQSYESHCNIFMNFFASCGLYFMRKVTPLVFMFRQSVNLFGDMKLEYSECYENLMFVDRGKENDVVKKFGFSKLKKVSVSEREIDCHYTELKNWVSQSTESEISKMDLGAKPSGSGSGGFIATGENKLRYKFEISIIKILKNFWDDEAKRREEFGVDGPRSVVKYIDKNNNLEGKFFTDHKQKFFVGQGNDLLKMTNKYSNATVTSLQNFLLDLETIQKQNLLKLTSETFADYEECNGSGLNAELIGNFKHLLKYEDGANHDARAKVNVGYNVRKKEYRRLNKEVAGSDDDSDVDYLDEKKNLIRDLNKIQVKENYFSKEVINKQLKFGRDCNKGLLFGGQAKNNKPLEKSFGAPLPGKEISPMNIAKLDKTKFEDLLASKEWNFYGSGQANAYGKLWGFRAKPKTLRDLRPEEKSGYTVEHQYPCYENAADLIDHYKDQIEIFGKVNTPA